MNQLKPRRQQHLFVSGNIKTDHMIKTIILQTLLTVSTTICLGQVSNSDNIKPKDTTVKSCHRHVENKTIELCNINADTLTYDQLKECNEITIRDSTKQIITSYLLSYFFSDGTTMFQTKGSSNQISSEAVAGIIASGTKKILFDEIFGIEGTKNLDLGHRYFYFK